MSINGLQNILSSVNHDALELIALNKAASQEEEVLKETTSYLRQGHPLGRKAADTGITLRQLGLIAGDSAIGGTPLEGGSLLDSLNYFDRFIETLPTASLKRT